MNERIQELARQARFTWVENDKDITGGVDLEKFAELIVKECFDEIVKGVPLAGFVRDRVLNHFGVKE